MKWSVALVGVGGIAQSHISGWLAQPDAEINLLCDVLPELARERQERYGLNSARVVTDLRQVLQSDCDLVDLCTPSALHAEQTCAALEAGKHVLCEKPMANTLAEAEAIAATARAHPDLVYLCEHRQLFDPLVVAVRERVADIGRPYWFRQRSAHALAISPGIAATGAFLDIGYHPLYAALHFLGPAQTVFALAPSLVRPEMVNDNGLYVLEHEQGVSVVEGSFSSIGPMGGTRPLELYGERGTFQGQWCPKPALNLYLGEQGGKPGPPEELEIPAGTWYGNAVRHFVDVVDGRAEPLAGVDAALLTMRTYDAALRSLKSGRKEQVGG